ncbi:MAG: protease SohB [Buchnera aphidicola (Schlechtendalia peitan)]
MNFISSYVLFFFKIFTICALILITFLICLSITRKKHKKKFELDVVSLNDHYTCIKNKIIFSMLSEYEKKIWNKRNKTDIKDALKNNIKFFKKNKHFLNNTKPILYVLDFNGNINATEVESLREEISAIILVAKKYDEVLLRLESGGGIINGYGLASSQLFRLKKHNIYLTVSVDKIAASGGYMMACVANHIIASPFSVLGSIGVVAQIPNFYKLLKKNNIDMELHTAGSYKRTLTIFGENTIEARKKFCTDLNFAHSLFKKFVHDMRPLLNIEEVSTGEHWFGSTALEKGLIDSIGTSDDFIMSKMKNFSILKIKYTNKKTALDSLFLTLKKNIEHVICKFLKI